jgi:hypothetical protein
LTYKRQEDFSFEVWLGRQSLWLCATWPSGGQVALRAAYSPDSKLAQCSVAEDESVIEYHLSALVGEIRVRLELPEPGQALLRWTTWLTPAQDLLIPFWPRDVYPLDEKGDPLTTRGIMHASQRDARGSVLYVTLTQPRSGSLLYLQNLTALNNYCEKTQVAPLKVVGGGWPELGYALPPTKDKPLPAGQEVVLSDAFVCLSPKLPSDEQAAAGLFLDLLADIYLHLPQPETSYRPWLHRADETLAALTHSPDCSVEKGNHRYLNAYVGLSNKPPESMVQLAVLVPLVEYAEWRGQELPLIQELKANLPTFYNQQLQTMVRWLPTDDFPAQDREEHESHRVMDSWYLYHTLLNLGRLALRGDEEARRLFLDSLDYAVKVAQHFQYQWPIFYDPVTLEVIKAEAKPGDGGETDVPGLYAHVMLQARDITGNAAYLEEAKRAAKSLEGLGFDLVYQFNSTVFSAVALIRLWDETGDELYRGLSYVCLANIFHNLWLWECDYGYARHYGTFLGLPPLLDAAYLAIYEELESLAAFQKYLEVGQDRLPPSINLLLTEYSRHVLNRTWFHYPTVLPPEMLVEKAKSGYINRKLAIPLEDIYEGWRKAGEVGQEIYGAGAAFAFVERAYHRVPGAAFLIYCDYFIDDFKVDPEGSSVSFRIGGDRRLSCRLRLIPMDEATLPAITVRTHFPGAEEEGKEGILTTEGHLEYTLAGEQSVTVEWTALGEAERSKK